MLLELLAIALVLLLNGCFAMAELAVVSARPARLELLARDGRQGAAIALKLRENPGRFLSSVQIGITLVGVLAGAFGGATLAYRLAQHLTGLGLSFTAAEAVAVALVVALITYFSLVVGELVPKQLALRDPEVVAARVAPAIRLVATGFGPLVSLLEGSSKLLLRLLGQRASGERLVSEDEIKALIAEAEMHGTVEPAEKRMITSVMRLGDRSVRSIMTPRNELDWLDLDAPREALLATLRASHHSRVPVARGTIDEVQGIVRARDVLLRLAESGSPELQDLLLQPPVLHDNADLLSALSSLQRSHLGMAFIVDEYGSLEGIVTASDILEAIAGDFAEPGDDPSPRAFHRDDGTWLVDGTVSIEELGELLGLKLPRDHAYHTTAGLILALLRRMPRLGDKVEIVGWVLEVVDMDGNRIDKILARPASP